MLFLFAALLFLISRALLLKAFPIFNDEAIYIQYAQAIHDNWQQNRFISMNGETYHDWKPPLQYWIAAPFIDWGNDPLLTARLIALAASAVGFVGFYLFARDFFGKREGLITAFLYALCPSAVFYNNQFIAETFLFSLAPLFYWAVLRSMRGNRPAIGWTVLSILLGTALLLIKQSGYLLLAISAFLPFARIPEAPGARERWKSLGLKFCLVLAVIVLSGLAADAILPSQFDHVRERFDSKWVMSPGEVLGLPFPIWNANLQLIGNYIGAYYCWTLVPLVGLFFWNAVRGRDRADLVLAAMFLTAAGAIAFLLRGFNEYMFNTAVLAVLLPLSARALVQTWQWRGSPALAWARHIFLACAGATIFCWCYQDTLMGVSAGKYLERSTPWAKANYLTEWSTGFGVREIVEMLAKEKRPGVVFVDPQWGNPRTALEVYARKRFPNLQLVTMTAEFLDESETKKIRDIALNSAPARFAIYSGDTTRGREKWMRTLDPLMCAKREEVRAYPSQMPIIVCQF